MYKILSWGGSATWNIMSKDVTLCNITPSFLSDGHILGIEDEPPWHQPALLPLIGHKPEYWTVIGQLIRSPAVTQGRGPVKRVPFLPISIVTMEWTGLELVEINSNSGLLLVIPHHIGMVMRKLTLTWYYDGEKFKQWQYKILLIISTNKTKPSLKLSRLWQFQTHHDDSLSYWLSSFVFYAFSPENAETPQT